jgi:cytochrome P450
MDSLEAVNTSATPLIPPHAAPADNPLPLWRFIPAFVRNPLRALPQRVYDDRLLYLKRANGTVWVMAPDLIEKILLTEQAHITKTPIERRIFEHSLGEGILSSDGPTWRWQRRTAAPLFRHADLLALIPAMVAAAEEQVTDWARFPKAGIRAIDHDMSATTFKIISRTIFAGAADDEANTIERAGTAFLNNITWELAAGILNIPKWVWHPGKNPSLRAAAEMRAAVAAILERRRQQGADGDDITARLIRARDPETGAPMSDSQLIDNLLTFLAAGHETTAKALTWALYLLARAPDWQDRVCAEVAQVAGNATLTAAHLDKLVLTKQVVKETMRLYPPAPVITRVPTTAMQLDDLHIPAHTHIVIPIYAIHRHRKLWDAPNAFDPTRFTPECEAKYARTQFMPFGFGPRICIGMSFAMMEAILLLATFVRDAKFSWDGAHLPEPVSRITLRPRGGMPLIVSMRKKHA